jgi:hypothetical protein
MDPTNGESGHGDPLSFVPSSCTRSKAVRRDRDAREAVAFLRRPGHGHGQGNGGSTARYVAAPDADDDPADPVYDTGEGRNRWVGTVGPNRYVQPDFPIHLTDDPCADGPCTDDELTYLQSLIDMLVDDLIDGKYIFHASDYSESDWYQADELPFTLIDYGGSVRRRLESGIEFRCMCIDNASGDYMRYTSTYSNTVKVYPKFWRIRASLPAGSIADRILAGILFHECVHMVDWETFALDDDVRFPIDEGAMSALSRGLATEYRAAFVQARYYRMSKCESQVFAETYLREHAPPFLGLAVSSYYVSKLWSRCIPVTGTALAFSILLVIASAEAGALLLTEVALSSSIVIGLFLVFTGLDF